MFTLYRQQHLQYNMGNMETCVCNTWIYSLSKNNSVFFPFSGTMLGRVCIPYGFFCVSLSRFLKYLFSIISFVDNARIFMYLFQFDPHWILFIFKMVIIFPLNFYYFFLNPTIFLTSSLIFYLLSSYTHLRHTSQQITISWEIFYALANVRMFWKITSI